VLFGAEINGGEVAAELAVEGPTDMTAKTGGITVCFAGAPTGKHVDSAAREVMRTARAKGVLSSSDWTESLFDVTESLFDVTNHRSTVPNHHST
jgi:hypothetical protein